MVLLTGLYKVVVTFESSGWGLVWINSAFLVFRQTCEENRSMLATSLKCVALCCQVCSFFCIVARFFQENASKLSTIRDTGLSSEASHEVESGSLATADTGEFPPNLFAEWQEFFSGNLFNAVLQLFMLHAGESRSIKSDHLRKPYLWTCRYEQLNLPWATSKEYS